jgi:hypothetical protein
VKRNKFNEFSNIAANTILQANRLDNLLDQLGCELKCQRNGLVYRGKCPVHQGDGQSFELRTDGDPLPIRWRCWSHDCHKKWKPSLLGLVRGILDATVADAMKYLNDFLAGVPQATNPGRRPRPKPESEALSLTREQVRGRLTFPSPYFTGRGFSPAVLDSMDVGHSPRVGYSIVPIYDDDGQVCVAYTSRWEKGDCPSCGCRHHEWAQCGENRPKWVMHPIGFPKGRYLYNYAAARASSSPFVVLVEGPGDVWKCNEAGIPAVACLGNDLTDSQAIKLGLLRRNVVVAFDNDDAGRQGATRAMVALRPHCWARRVRAVQIPEGHKDLAEMSAEAVAEWFRSVQV